LDSTHPKDSNEVLFVIFWLSILFSIDFTRSATKQGFEFEFEKGFDWIDRGLTGRGDVVQSHWSIPIR
jgi:hypothetical protein